MARLTPKVVIAIGCFSPRMAEFTGIYTESGKPKYRMIPFYEDACGKTSNGLPIITIPCGKCVGCRLEKSKQWANRLMLEKSYYDDAECWFVTLTYDNDHLESITTSNENGEFIGLSLNKRDLQLFMKRLRKKYSDCTIRFFACGEYGEKNKRPHFHLILFGLPLDDTYPFGRNELGQPYYRSPGIEEVWPFGYVGLGRVTWDSCAYVARYIMKKKYGKEAETYDSLNIEPEFIVMSRRPGIGRQFYEDNREKVFEHDHFYIGTDHGSKYISIPKYFERLEEEINPDLIQQLRSNRRVFADQVRIGKELATSNDYLSICEAERENLMKRIRSLERK